MTKTTFNLKKWLEVEVRGSNSNFFIPHIHTFLYIRTLLLIHKYFILEGSFTLSKNYKL